MNKIAKKSLAGFLALVMMLSTLFVLPATAQVAEGTVATVNLKTTADGYSFWESDSYAFEQGLSDNEALYKVNSVASDNKTVALGIVKQRFSGLQFYVVGELGAVQGDLVFTCTKDGAPVTNIKFTPGVTVTSSDGLSLTPVSMGGNGMSGEYEVSVSVKAPDPDPTVTVDAGSGVATNAVDGDTVTPGSDYSFSVSALDGYKLESVEYSTDGGATWTSLTGANGNYIIRKVTGNVTIKIRTIGETYKITQVGAVANVKFENIIVNGTPVKELPITDVAHNTSIIFGAAGEAGYTLKSVKVNGITVNPVDGKYTVIVTADTTLEFEVDAISYMVNLGTNSDKVDVIGIWNGLNVDCTSEITFVVTPKAGYTLTKVTATGATVTGENGNYTLTNVTDKVTVNFEVVPVNTTVTVEDNTNVTTNIPENYQPAFNSDYTFMASANDGWKIVSVSYTYDGTNYTTLKGVNGSYTIYGITGAVSIKIVTEELNYTITKIGVGTNVTILGLNDTETYNSAKTFTVTVNPLYRLKAVKVNSVTVIGTAGENNTYTYTISITGDTTVEVEVEEILYTVSLGTNNDKVDMTGFHSGMTVNPNGCAFTIVAKAGYKLGNVSATNAKIELVDGKWQLSNVTGNVVISFEVTTIRPTITLKDADHVQTDLIPGDSITYNSNLTFTVSGKDGYRVTKVSYTSGDKSGTLIITNGSCTIREVTDNVTITFEVAFMFDVNGVTATLDQGKLTVEGKLNDQNVSGTYNIVSGGVICGYDKANLESSLDAIKALIIGNSASVNIGDAKVNGNYILYIPSNYTTNNDAFSKSTDKEVLATVTDVAQDTVYCSVWFMVKVGDQYVVVVSATQTVTGTAAPAKNA